MNKKTHIEEVADFILSNKRQATHPDFFYRLNLMLMKKGYKLEAHQSGVRGTHIVLVAINESDRTPDAGTVGQYEQD